MNRIGKARRSALLGGSAIMVALFASSSAQAQCVGSAPFAFGGIAADFGPTAAGAAASVNSLISVLNTSNTAFLTQTNAFISAPPNPQPDQTGGGVWTRGIGGRINNESVGVLTVGVPNAFNASGTITCNTKTRTDFGGYQAGVDVAKLNVGGVNIHAGTTVGYVEANARDVSPPPPGATFKGNFQIPFAGVYAALTYGGFFLDAQVRADFYEMNLTDPTNGIFGQNLSASGTTFTSNVGYNYAFNNSWFVEPSAGVVWSRVDPDPLNVSGSLILAAPGVAPPTNVRIGEIESLLGRASVRFGTNFTTDNLALQPFVTLSVFHEFAPSVGSSITTSFSSLIGPSPEINSTLLSSRVGTYGQFAVGMAGQVLNTGWLGYARVDFRTGDNIDGISVNGGIRYQFTPEQIAAAIGKAPIYKAPPAAVPVAYNWTGFYLGGYAGTTWGSTHWVSVFPPFNRVNPDFAGVVAGGQIGYNYQIGHTVVGLEGDLGWTNAKGARSCPNQFFFTCENHMDWLSTVTGRLGYAWDRVLVYGKGGFATARVDERTSFNPDSQPLFPLFLPPAAPGNGFTDLTPPVPSVQSARRTPVGWTLGAGVEFGLTPNWSAKAEYLYYDLGRNTYTFTASTFTNTVTIRETGNLVRVGVNYRFADLFAPIVTKY